MPPNPVPATSVHDPPVEVLEEEPEEFEVTTVFDLQQYLLDLIELGHVDMHIYVMDGDKECHPVLVFDHGRLYIVAGNPALLMME